MMFRRAAHEFVQMQQINEAVVFNMGNGMAQRIHHVRFESILEAAEYLEQCRLEIALWGFRQDHADTYDHNS